MLTDFLSDTQQTVENVYFLMVSIMDPYFSAFNIIKSNDEHFVMVNIICYEFYGEFISSVDSYIILQNFLLKKYKFDNCSQLNMSLISVSNTKLYLDGIVILDSGCQYLIDLYTSDGYFSKIYMTRNKTMHDSMISFFIFSSIVRIELLVIINIHNSNNLIRGKLSQIYIKDFTVLYDMESQYQYVNFLYCETCSNLTLSLGVLFRLCFSQGSAFFIINKSPENIKSTVNINNVKIIQNLVLSIGGPIYIENAFMTINHSLFINNSAIDGGGLYLICKASTLKLLESYCSFVINDCNFTHNNALHSGGGFYWENSLPLENNCLYINNTAKFGSDKSSNSIKIIMKQGSVGTFYSGEWWNDLNHNLTFWILDYYDQIVNT